MEDIRRGRKATSTGSSLRDDIQELKNILETQQGQETTKKKKKEWKMPFSWRRTVNRARKDSSRILVFYLDMKGRMQKPKLLPILSGDIVMIRHKAYDANPEAMWTLGKKGPKALIIREIDRRPISNLDYKEVKEKGFATDADEILIKATMKAIQSGVGKGMSKGVIVVMVIIIMVALAYFFTQGP